MASYPEIGSGSGSGGSGSVSDRQHLIGDEGGSNEGGCGGRARRHKWCIIVSVILAAILVGHALAVFFLYFQCSNLNCVGLKIMTLNTWGMPGSLGSKFKSERMEAIAREIGKAEFDLYLLEELWMRPDHETIREKIPDGYHMTYVGDLALPTCEGRLGPDFCSGLAVVSKFPLLEKEFNSFTWHGDLAKSLVDGEWLARKGVGRVRISPMEGMEVDVFVTHTAADPDPSHGYNNSYYRDRQVRELMDSYILKSTADVAILGGDFNAGPSSVKGEPYQMIREYMKNCIEDIFYKLLAWLNPQYATYGNQKNSFSNQYSPVIYDYIFYRNNRDDFRVWTNLYDMPLFKFFLKKDDEISFSDHEAVTATIYIWR